MKLKINEIKLLRGAVNVKKKVSLQTYISHDIVNRQYLLHLHFSDCRILNKNLSDKINKITMNDEMKRFRSKF